jgi:plasmid stabilization system protein ParE
MKHRVVVLSRARTQISGLLNWLVERSPEGANRWLDALDAALLDLEDDPHRFGTAPESAGLSHEIREILFQTPHGRRYRLLFTIAMEEVRILGVRGPGQDLASPGELEN